MESGASSPRLRSWFSTMLKDERWLAYGLHSAGAQKDDGNYNGNSNCKGNSNSRSSACGEG